MSAGTLLLFLGRGEGIAGWLRIGADGAVERGEGVETLPPFAIPGEDPLHVAAIVPGEQVVLHWLELPPGLSQPQAAAAARLMAAELTAEPPEEAHVAVGSEQGGNAGRCVAVASSARIAEWLQRCHSIGADPDMILPETLLLPVRAGKAVRYETDGLALYRSPGQAFAVEPEIAPLLLNGAAIEPVEAAEIEAGLESVLAEPAVDLRQGPFAKRKKWKIDLRNARRLALLGMAILLVTLAIHLVSITRYTFAADLADAEASRLAGSALPGGTRVTNPVRQLEARLAERRGSGVGYSALASALFAAVRVVPNTELSAITYDGVGGLRASVTADSAASIAALEQQVEAGGLEAESGAAATSNGRQAAELTVRAR